jgi:hypothetical protein
MNGYPANQYALAAALMLVGAGFATPAAAQPTVSPPPVVRANPTTERAIASAGESAPYPTFGQIPALPTDVRTIAGWKASVMSIKAEGAQMTEMAAAEPWTLGDTDNWAAQERAAAAPPAPITQASSEADTEAFAAAMRARAMPPPRKR